MPVTLTAIPGLPPIAPGDDLGGLLGDALQAQQLSPQPGDLLSLCSKVVSKAEGRFVDLSGVTPGAEAHKLADETEKDPRLVELILQESAAVSRRRPGALIVRHKLGLVSANAAIDSSNACPPGAPPDSGPWVLLLPEAPDRSASALRESLRTRFGVAPGVLITDSLGRPFRVGTVGAAIGLAGVPAIWDQRGLADADGREMEFTITAFADQVAAAADLVAGQGAEGTPAVLIRGLDLPPGDDPDNAEAQRLLRDPEMDLYA